MQRLAQKSIWHARVSGELLLGKVKQVTTIGLQRQACLKIKVTKNNFYEYNRMFYVTSAEEWSLDPESKCRVGDVVLIRRLPEQHRPSKTIQYSVDKVVFHHGKFVDPVTKRRVYGAKEFEREVELRKDLVGQIFNDPLDDEDISESEDGQRSQIRRRVAERRRRTEQHQAESIEEGDETA